MDTCWLNKLIDLLQVQSNSENEKLMVLYLDKELRKLKLPYTIDAVGNILVTKGKAKTYPCVVSHMDTVHNFVSDFKLYRDIDDKDTYFAMNGKQRAGIGGDDKCGVFACLYLLKKIPEIKVVFFSREESGCRGSMNINKEFFADCRYIIQLDRRGKGDFIQAYLGTKTISHEFSSEIGLIKKKYKYKTKIGTITDVMKLWNNRVGVSCINLSCGYYRPHTDYEYISIADLWHSVKFTEEIINTMQPKKYPSLPPPIVISTPVIGRYRSIYSQCYKCKKWKKDVLLHKVRGSKTNKMICWPCKKEGYNKKTKVTNDTASNIHFACHECGLTVSQLKAGDSLKPFIIDKVKYLYCSGCMVLLTTESIEEKTPVKCESCQEIIPKDHYFTIIQGLLVCGECANVLRGYIGKDSIKKCWVCDRVIPKDHKVIERFGTRICEDCAYPSDTEIN